MDNNRDDLTKKQLGADGLSQYAVFLPAISGFYATFIGKQRSEEYVDPARFPQGLTDMEQMNWLNSQIALFPYKWSLYSGGHANLDLTKPDSSEDMVRNRDPNTLILGDSGGFQIAKGLWEGDWKANSGCPKARKQREQVLAWLDGVADYGMCLDIPSWIVHNGPVAAKTGISTHQDAVDATRYNNEYFMNNRKGVKNGGAKFLNVLQGANHTEADEWYEIMKGYCDPAKYPDTHLNGWAMGGQNMCDVHLILDRISTLRFDGLLQEGVHDWMHFLGTSRLEWAVLLTVIQRAVRKYVNPKFTISFDCASPFLATANGQVYYENSFEHDGKWTYSMGPCADNKKYATDTRNFGEAVVADGVFPTWQDSPLSRLWQMKDICIYKPGDLNKNGKEGKTSWDSFSYALLMGHNVWMHLTAVQEANRRFDAGEHPKMMRRSGGDYIYFEAFVERVFAAPDLASAKAITKEYSEYCEEILGGRGNAGKNATNSDTMQKLLIDIEGNYLAKDKPSKKEKLAPLLDHIEIDGSIVSNEKSPVTKARPRAAKLNPDLFDIHIQK